MHVSKWLLTLLILLCSGEALYIWSSEGRTHIRYVSRTRVVRVIDGDTLVFDARAWSPFPNLMWKIRIAGIDTPEIHGKCSQEHEAAERAKNALGRLLKDNNDEIIIKNAKFDKYGGRFVADVILNDGRSVSSIFLGNGLAREYHGVGPKTQWCEVLSNAL